MNRRIFRNIKNRFQSLLKYAEKHPIISFMYVVIFIIGISLRIVAEQKMGSLSYDEGSQSIGGVFISRFFLNVIQRRYDPAIFVKNFFIDYSTTIAGLWYYPFGYSFFTAITYPLFGYNEFAARLPSLIFSVLLIHATVSIAKEIDPREKVALVSAFLAALSPSVIMIGSSVSVDIPPVTLTTYSTLYFIKGIKNRANNSLLRAGLLGGFAGLIKPTGVIILPFMVTFQSLMFLILRDRLITSKKFWMGLSCGFLLFSTWWMSALLLKVAEGGWLGEEAFRKVLEWVYVSTGCIPAWYSPPWYKYQGWTYYTEALTYLMGLLPLIFSFIGIGCKLRKMKRSDVLLISYSASMYVLLSFLTTKNIRYVVVCLPTLYIYASLGLITTYEKINERAFQRPSVSSGRKIMRGLISAALIVIFVLVCLTHTFIAMRDPQEGMGTSAYNPFLPMQEVMQIISNDKDEGVIIYDSEDNYFNIQTISFYVASVDYERKYACHWGLLSDPKEIFSVRIGEKEAKYVLVHDPKSALGEYIGSNPDYFILLGSTGDNYGTISVYKIVP